MTSKSSGKTGEIVVSATKTSVYKIRVGSPKYKFSVKRHISKGLNKAYFVEFHA